MVDSKKLYYWLIGLIFVLALALRGLIFFYNDVYNDDECRLLCVMANKSFLQMFLPLDYAQSAPPLYLILLKAISSLSGENERVLKLLPFLLSLGSVFVFYKVSLNFLNKKYSVLLANLFFAINIFVLQFSSIIKQYSCDIFICLLCLYFLPRVNILRLDGKKLLVLGVIITLLPLISLPSLFFIGSFFVMNLIKNYKEKIFYKRACLIIFPFFITMCLYYFFNLAPSKVIMDRIFPNYWDEGFINILHTNVVRVFALYIKAVFYPNLYILFELILLVLGIYYSIKQKKSTTIFCVGVFGFVLLASLLHLYPFRHRVALYGVPLFILFCIKPLDSIKIKSFLGCLFILFTLIGFCGYNLNFAKMLVNRASYITYSPKNLMAVLKEKYNPEVDSVIFNNASKSSYVYYSKRADFYTLYAAQIPKYDVNEFLEKLSPQRRYWFYLVKDYKSERILPTIIEWAENNKIIYNIQEQDSHLMLVEKLR